MNEDTLILYYYSDGLTEEALGTAQVAGRQLMAEVEDRHRGQALLRAGLFQPGAGFGIHQCEQDKPGIGFEFGQDPFKVLPAAHHRPEMAHHVRVLELRKRRLGEHFERFAG